MGDVRRFLGCGLWKIREKHRPVKQLKIHTWAYWTSWKDHGDKMKRGG
jgi:hypothetical protein